MGLTLVIVLNLYTILKEFDKKKKKKRGSARNVII